MGGFVKFECLSCGYSEERIGFGHGAQAEPTLQLYRCNKCKSVGSNWVQKGQDILCGSCYNEDIELLEPKNRSMECPKCDTLAVIRVLDETWD